MSDSSPGLDPGPADAAEFDVVSLGEAMIEFNQLREGAGRHYLQGYGGDTSNVAIAAARHGARVAYVTRLGGDEFGRLLLDLWASEGVDTTGVDIGPDEHTGVYFVTHSDTGHAFSYLRSTSAASRMAPAQLPESVIAAGRFLHVSGISQAISAQATDTVFHAIRIARAAGRRVSYDPNLRLRLWPVDRASAVIRATVARADVFLPGVDDLKTLTGIEDPRALLDWSHDQGARVVALKMGGQGVWVSDGTYRERIAPHRVDAVDATGAGDCFDGTFLARLAQGDGAVDAARYANAAAALAVTGYGAVEPIPSPGAVRAFLAG